MDGSNPTSTTDFDAHAISQGWLKLKLGWYHPLARSYPGWGAEFRSFRTASEALAYQFSVTYT